MATTTQEKTVAGLLADLGITGFRGIAATIGSPTTKLDITVTQPAWAILADGTVLASELATTSITGLTTNASSHLWLTATLSASNYAPVWTVATSAPDATAIKIADVTISGNVISAVTLVATGLQGLKQALTLAPTTPAFPASTTWVQNTTGQDVVAYLGLTGVTQTALYVSPTNGTTGAINLTTQAATGMAVVIPNSYWFALTYSAGTPTWKWEGLRSL